MDVGKKVAVIVSALILLFCAPMPHVSSDSSVFWDIALNFSEEAVKK